MEQKDFFSQIKGSQSLSFQKPPYILASGNVVGKKEGEGPLGKEFDVICEDDKFGADNWEDAESTLQKDAVALALGKAGLEAKDIRYIFAGDLLGQNIATSFGLMDYEIPLFGLYGACSTAGESMALGAMCVAAGYAKNVLTLTSSHFASAEKQFRFPWSMPIKDHYQLPGRLPEVVPLYLAPQGARQGSQGSRPERS